VPLYEIRIHFETDQEQDVERLLEAFELAICPHAAADDHRCPNRWNIMTTELPLMRRLSSMACSTNRACGKLGSLGGMHRD
jgi:hypothetical protein